VHCFQWCTPLGRAPTALHAHMHCGFVVAIIATGELSDTGIGT